MGFGGGGGSGGAIGAATDVALNNPVDNQVLTYNSSVGKWQNISPTGGSDATTSAKGIVQLAGDLGGTAASPTVPGLAAKADSSTVTTALSGKEPTLTAGTTGQYYRGDKSWQTLDKSAVGLSNVENTSDANKPISSTTQTALNAKEASITTGTTSQYYRGDKSWQTLDKSAVGLSNVDNTSDANKPISSATQTALNAKADATSVGAKVLLIDTAAALPAGTPAGIVVIVKA